MASIGKKLKDARISKKLSIDDISEKTKIRKHILIAMEEENFSILPPVYARATIVSYAQALKIPESEILDDLNSVYEMDNPDKYVKIQDDSHPNTYLSEKRISIFSIILRKVIEKLQIKFSSKNPQYLVNYLIYIAIGIAFIGIIYYSIFSGYSHKSSNLNEPQSKGGDTTVVKSGSKGFFDSFDNNKDSLIIQAKATDTAWMEVFPDGQNRESCLIAPKEEKRWAVRDFLQVTVGNAGAVQFTRNGVPIGALGSKGVVVKNIKITRNDIINPNIPNPKDSTIKHYYKKKKEPEPPPPILEPSPIDKKAVFQSNDKDKKPLDKDKKNPKP